MSPTFGLAAEDLVPHKRAPVRAHQGGYYIRLIALDQPGTMAAIATRMAQYNISLESIVQRKRHGGTVAEGDALIILMTHETTEQDIRNAIVDMQADGRLTGEAQMIRIEKAV